MYLIDLAKAKKNVHLMSIFKCETRIKIVLTQFSISCKKRFSLRLGYQITGQFGNRYLLVNVCG